MGGVGGLCLNGDVEIRLKLDLRCSRLLGISQPVAVAIGSAKHAPMFPRHGHAYCFHQTEYLDLQTRLPSINLIACDASSPRHPATDSGSAAC